MRSQTEFQINPQILRVRAALLTPDGLEKWLKSKSTKAIVGKSQNFDANPIAMYLSEALGVNKPEVTEYLIQTQEPVPLIFFTRTIHRSIPRIPNWVGVFIIRIDNKGDGADVTGAEALDLIEEMFPSK